MMYKGTQIVEYMVDRKGSTGSDARAYCGLSRGMPWCNAQVTYTFYKNDVKTLYCNGRKEVGCPHSIQWCYSNLADIPIFLALPGDIIYFDWEPNGNPNHIGFVKEAISDAQIETVEGNTSGGIIDIKIREERFVQAVFRPHYPVPKSSYDVTKTLTIDGKFGFNTIAKTQYVLGVDVDCILGQVTVKAIQALVGTKVDGSWGKKTTRALQKFLAKEKLYTGKIDGFCGPKTVKAFQKYLNREYKKLKKFYNKTVIIGQATADEYGNIRGGKAGDQTGKEVATAKFSYSPSSGAYNHWTHMFRAKDKKTRLKLAQAMLDACENKHVGYDQDGHDRGTLYDEAAKVDFVIADVTKNCETTCASVISVCCRAVGVPKKYAPRYNDSSQLVKHLSDSKLFNKYTDASHLSRATYLQAGDILISKGHHTCMVVKSPNN